MRASETDDSFERSRMSDERKKPGVAFWATVALVVGLLAYPLSYGPSIWLVRRGYLPNMTIGFYAPMTWLHENAPVAIREVIRWWARLWQ